MDTILLIGRIILGVLFAWSGLMHLIKMNDMIKFTKSKKVPLPGIAVVATGLMLLAAGLGLLLWKLVVPGMIIGVVFLVLASVMMHNFWKIADPKEKMTQMHFFMGNFMLIGALLVIMGLA